VEEIEQDILQENIQYLLDEYYDGNVSKMQRQTGANRSVISELKNGSKNEVNSSTLRHFAQAGININWLLTGVGPHFVIGNEEELKTELKQKQLLENRMAEIKELVSEIDQQLEEHPELKLDPDVMSALLDLLKRAI